MINLEDFVAETLRQIIGGVINAQKYAHSIGAEINPSSIQLIDEMVRKISNSGGVTYGQMVAFDIAITATDTDQIKGGLAVLSGVFSLGGQASNEMVSSSVSRVKFSIPVFFPKQS